MTDRFGSPARGLIAEKRYFVSPRLKTASRDAERQIVPGSFGRLDIERPFFDITKTRRYFRESEQGTLHENDASRRCRGGIEDELSGDNFLSARRSRLTQSRSAGLLLAAEC